MAIIFVFWRGIEEGMKMVLVEARVLDSTHLELSSPIAAICGGTVFVSVAEPAERNAERRQWLAGSVASLQAAYGDSEPEYTVEKVTMTDE